MDMNTDGRVKEEPYQYIYIQAPEKEAKIIFYNRFGHNPEHVTCKCCGKDYSISESNTLAQASAHERGCKYEGDEYVEQTSDEWWRKYMTVEEYSKQEDVLIIPADQIKDSERLDDAPA